MAEEKKEKIEATDTAATKSPSKKKIKGRNRLLRWFREMKSELKKVVWPTPKQIVNNTIVALTVMSISAVVIWGIDYMGSQIFQAIRLLAGR